MVVSKNEFLDRLYSFHGGKIALTGEYTKITDKMMFVCLVCGHQWLARASAVASASQRQGCPICKLNKLRDCFKLNIEEVRRNIDAKGCKLISTDYVNAHTALKIQCNCGNIFSMTYNNFQSGQGCPKCSWERANKSKAKSMSEIISMLTEDNLELICFPNGYYNRRSLMQTKCKKGHIVERSLASYYLHRGCPECTSERMSELFRGENSPSWKGGITSIEFFLRNRLTQWKNDSKKFCNYRCIFTGDRFGAIHHLYSFNLIVSEAMENISLDVRDQVSLYSNEELESLEQEVLRLHYEYPMGVCLRDDIHDLFHSLYGKGDNTPEQFDEFKSRWYFGEFKNKIAS